MAGNLSDAGGGNKTAQPGVDRYGASGLKGPWENYSQGHSFKKCSCCGTIIAPSQTGMCELCERLSHSQSMGRPAYDETQEAGDKSGVDNQVID